MYIFISNMKALSKVIRMAPTSPASLLYAQPICKRCCHHQADPQISGNQPFDSG